MRFGIGNHTRHWHARTILLALVLAALALLLMHRPTGGRAYAMEPPTESDTTTSGSPAASESSPESGTGQTDTGYISEIVDSTFTVGPAEFFALDLPTNPPGASGVHLFGTVTTRGKGKDIIVRLFRARDYDRWLKQKSGVKPAALWTSPRSRSLTLDQELPPGEPIVLLLDNGYSIRTPKHVICQLQIRYVRHPLEVFDTEGTSGSGISAGGVGSPAQSGEENLPPPRANSEEEMPPPPPPPPTDY